MINKNRTLTVRAKILRVLKGRKTALSTKELAMKAGVNHSSARRELNVLYRGFMADRRFEKGEAFWTRGIALN